MDVEAIARRIAQDHGVTVLEKDVIETLEKLKAANKDKTTGAGEAQKPSKVPEVSPITSAGTSTAPVNPTPAPLPTGTSTSSAPLPNGSEHVKPVPAPLPTGSGAPSAPLNPVPAPVKTGSEQPSSLKIPAEVKPLPITLIDDLIIQGYSRDGIEAILKANGHNAYRKLIGERMKVVKPVGRGAVTPASNARPMMGTGAASLGTGAAPLTSGAESANRPATDVQNVSITKTPEIMGNSGISGENRVAPPIAPLQAGSAPLQTSSARLSTGAGAPSASLPIGSGTSSEPLPADVPSLVAALEQFLASYKQPSGTVPAASEQPNESDST
ncbi:MAG TPA: hypothetical protein VJZ75_06520 [Candidatus Bathyarchaeia archaeon]|nr:hypothetical protein [Candidatus Bathyarchaeia archaeon]